MEENKNLMEMNLNEEERDLEEFAIFEANDSELTEDSEQSEQDVNKAVILAVGAVCGVAAYVAYDKFVKPVAEKAADKISNKIVGFVVKRREAKRAAMEDEPLEAEFEEVEVEE